MDLYLPLKSKYLTHPPDPLELQKTIYNFCCLLIIFANSLDPDQDWLNVGPELDSNGLTLW